MKVAICDPSLKDDTGHHLEYQIALTNAILTNTEKTSFIWYANKNNTLIYDEIDFDLEVISHYNLDFYQPEFFDFEKWKEDFNCVLRDCLEKKVSKVIYHTSLGDDLKCLLAFISNYRDIEFHMCTPYSPRYMPGSVRGAELVEILEKLQSFSNFMFWSETIELSDYYLSIGVRSQFLGIPTWDETAVKHSSTQVQKKYSDKLTISYIGPARDEKRFDEFAAAIELLSRSADPAILSQINEIFVSIVEPKRGYSESVSASISLLKGIQNINIVFCDRSLSREDYLKQVSKSHLVWLAYDRKAYADGRGSGILVDCIASGTCFIARAGTTPQHYLRGNGFVIDSADHCSCKIKDFLNTANKSGAACIELQHYFLSNYSAQLLASKLNFESNISQVDNISSTEKQPIRSHGQILKSIFNAKSQDDSNRLIPSNNANIAPLPYTFCIVTTTFNGGGTILKTISSVLQQDSSLKIRYHIQISARTNDNTLDQVTQLEKIISFSYTNVVFSWAVADDSGLYDGLLKAFDYVLPDCHEETWMGWINDDDQLLPDTARILYEIQTKLPYVNFLTATPSVRGDVNSTNRKFRLSSELVRHGLYDGKHMPCVQQEGTFWKAKIWKKYLDKISEAWSNYKLAGDYCLWRLMAKQTDFYFYDQPLAVFHIDSSHQQLSSNFAKYNAEVDLFTPADERIKAFNQYVKDNVLFEQLCIPARNWSLEPEFIKKTTFKIPIK
ncbi:glycosyltransferase [Synechococcus sp. AH-736-G21]|nr:glycosyltransferase [Synechococcus sp. AH-736-G21]